MTLLQKLFGLPDGILRVIRTRTLLFKNCCTGFIVRNLNVNLSRDIVKCLNPTFRDAGRGIITLSSRNCRKMLSGK